MASYSNKYDICSSKYGKSGIRLLHIQKTGDVHTPKELEVTTRLTLSTKIDYTHGDNSKIIATDSQKNIVYILAKKHGVTSPEEFALIVSQFFLDQYPHVTDTAITVVQRPWERYNTPEGPHNHAFVHTPTVERWASVSQSRTGPPQLRAGLSGLRVLKTTKSAFTNFVRDQFRTLPDAEDRIFSTVVSAEWTYSTHIGVDFDKAWTSVLDGIMVKFAGGKEGLMSPSVQHTLYLACVLALDTVPQISWIQMDMPNCHYLNLDLSVFPRELVGGETNQTVFLPIDKPSGFIHAALSRSQYRAKL